MLRPIKVVITNYPADQVEELYSMSGDDIRTTIQQGFQRTLDTLVGLVNANPASRRPLLDIHHIQLFLLWRMLSPLML